MNPQETRNRAFWNMSRVLERILTSCNFQPDAPTRPEKLQVLSRVTTKSGKTIITIKRPNCE